MKNLRILLKKDHLFRCAGTTHSNVSRAWSSGAVE